MPKTKEQFEAIRQERKDAILNAALYLFATRGYDATTTDTIAATINCSHGLIYHYFPTKESLIDAVFEYEIRPISRKIFENVNFLQKAKFVLIDVVEAFLRALKSNNDEYVWGLHLLLNLHVTSLTNPLMKQVGRKRNVHNRLLELIERGKEEGDFKLSSTKEQSAALLALFKGLAHNRLKVGYKKFICPSSDIIMSMLLK